MTVPQDPVDPALTEEEEREVAALLADTQGHGPLATPPEVVARLEDVLAGLAAERAERPATTATTAAVGGAVEGGSGTGASVVSLEERRRARRWPRALLAAAAVVAGGYGVANLVDGSLMGSSGGDSSAGAGSVTQDSAGTESKRAGGSGGGLSGSGQMSVVPTVRRDHLAADVRRVVRLFDGHQLTEGPSGDPSVDPSDSAGDGGTVDEGRACPVPRLADGQRLYEVRYRGAPAGLVLGAPRQGSVDVTVYSCEDGGVRLTRTVPAP